MTENHNDMGLRWEHDVWPDGEPFLRTDLWLRLTLHRCEDGHLEVVALDMDNRLGIAAVPLPLDESVRELVSMLPMNQSAEEGTE